MAHVCTSIKHSILGQGLCIYVWSALEVSIKFCWRSKC